MTNAFIKGLIISALLWTSALIGKAMAAIDNGDFSPKPCSCHCQARP